MALLLVTQAHAGNVLTNSGFELSNFTGWTPYGSHAVESTNNTYYNGGNPGGSNVLTHSGEYVGKTWGQFTGGANYSGAYQESVAGAGSIWAADAFALSHEQDLIQANNQFWVEVTFRDSSDTILAMFKSYVLDPVSAEGVTSNSWYHLAITNEIDIAETTYTTITNTVASFTAPAGTAKVRLQVVFYQMGGYPGGSVYFDDLTLNKISGTDPDITASPASHSRVTGQSVSFTVSAVGATTLHYQWRKDTNPLSDGANVSGATSATLTLANLALSDAGAYDVQVSDVNGSILSPPATLTVLTPAEAANYLFNPGLESGAFAPYWSAYNGAGVPPAPASVHSGTYVGQAYGAGANSYNGFYQDARTDDTRVVAPGSTFAADGWVFMSSSDPITADNTAWLEVHFHDSNGNMLGLYKSAIIDANFTTDTWLDLPVTNIIAFWGDYSVVATTNYLSAPANTAYVRYQTVMHVGTGGGTGSVLFDDMSLMAKIPVTISLSINGSQLGLSFPTQGATSYQVLYKTNLEDPAWSLLTTINGDGSVKTVTDPISATKRFYRVNTL